MRLSDRVALFDQGRIEQIGSGRDLYDDRFTRVAAGFIEGVPIDGVASDIDDRPGTRTRPEPTIHMDHSVGADLRSEMAAPHRHRISQ